MVVFRDWLKKSGSEVSPRTAGSRKLTRDMVRRQSRSASPSPPPLSLPWTRRPPFRKQKSTGSLWPATWLSICMP